MNAKTSSERVKELRQRRQAKGLTRIEIYAHPSNHAAIHAYAARLEKKRLKQLLRIS